MHLNKKRRLRTSVYEQILQRYIPTQGTATSPEELVEFVQVACEYAQQNGRERSKRIQ
jgi:hypothetical protein